MMKEDKPFLPYVLLVLTTLFWSGNFVVSRGMHEQIPPFALSFWRWSAALLLLAPFALPRLLEQRPLIRRHLGFIAIQGLLGVTGFNSLIYLAVQTTTAINAVLVNSCIPVLIVVCSWLLYRETMSPRQCLGVLVSLSGVVLIVAEGDPSFAAQLSFNRGDLFVLGAAVLWAFYSANLKRYPRGLHPLSYQAGIMIAGLLGILPFFLAEQAAGNTMRLTGNVLAVILYVALFASVLAFLFWNRAVRTIGANRAGPFIHLMPVFSTILAVLFLGESLRTFHITGALLIFTGILLTTTRVAR